MKIKKAIKLMLKGNFLRPANSTTVFAFRGNVLIAQDCKSGVFYDNANYRLMLAWEEPKWCLATSYPITLEIDQILAPPTQKYKPGGHLSQNATPATVESNEPIMPKAYREAIKYREALKLAIDGKSITAENCPYYFTFNGRRFVARPIGCKRPPKRGGTLLDYMGDYGNERWFVHEND